MDELRVRDRRPRQRVSKACDSCRSRKDRCDGRKPTCSTCLKLGKACLYNAQSKKRGLKEGYVRGLEKLWALALRRIPGFEQELITVLREATIAGRQQDELVNSWFELDENLSLIKTWKDSALFREFDQVLEVLDALPDKATKKEAITEAQNSITVTPIANIDALDAQVSDTEALAESHVLNTEDQISNTEPQKNSNTAAQVPKTAAHSTPDLPSAAWQLIELYFTYSHCWFPVLEKHDVVKVLYELSNRTSPRPNESGPHCVLWALFAYAETQFSTLKGSPDDTTDDHNMYNNSRTLIPTDPDDFTIFHIQALLLLTLADMHKGKWRKAWLTIGLASRAALLTSLGSVSTTKGGREVHVLYGCFLLDTIVSARLNRHPQFKESDISLVTPVDESGLEEWEPWKGASVNLNEITSKLHAPCAGPSTFNQLIRVIRHLNSPLSNSGQTSLDLFTTLRAWGTEQPFFSHMDLSVHGKAHIKYPLLPHQIHLRLSYIATLLHIYVASNLLSDQPYLEYVLALVGQGCRLIEKHAIFFGYGTLPPTYEYCAHVLCDTLEAMFRCGVNVSPIRGDLRDMKDSTSDISIVWPVFQPTRDRYHAIFAAYSQSNAHLFSPILHHRQVGPVPSDPFSSPRQSPGSWPDALTSIPTMPGDQPGLTLPNDISGMGAASDVDSVLQDFGTLDAMEWMNNWEESLSHLGFADGSGMNQEFQAFWRNMQSS